MSAAKREPLYRLTDDALRAIAADPSETAQTRHGARQVLAMRQVQRGEIRGAGPIQRGRS